MVFKKLHLGSVSFGKDAMEELTSNLYQAFEDEHKKKEKTASTIPNTSELQPRATLSSTQSMRMKWWWWWWFC
jgi:hypothetical protein